MVYIDLGVLTESEFIRLAGCSPKDVGAKAIELANEEGDLKVFYVISLHDLPPHELTAIRKVRLSHSTCVQHLEHLLLPERQLTQDQGKTWANCASRQLVKSRPSSLTFAGRGGLHSLEYYRNKAAELEVRRSQALEAEAAENEAESPEEEDILGEMDGDATSRPRGPAHEDFSAPALGSLFSATTSASKTGKGKKPLTRRKGKKAEDEEDDNASSVLPGCSKMTPAELARVDGEMAVVARRHEQLTNRSSPSLSNLSVKRFLAGEKLGQVINGARL